LLLQAAALLKCALDATPPGPDRASVLLGLGAALWKQRTGDRESNVENAICHFQAALEVFTRKADPHSWARAHGGLAAAYRDRLAGERKDNIETAIQHSQLALDVCTRKADPCNWAMICINLAASYSKRLAGERKDNIEILRPPSSTTRRRSRSTPARPTRTCGP
jgi:hypothetical protein